MSNHLTAEQILTIAGLPITESAVSRLMGRPLSENIEDEQSEACEAFDDFIGQISDPSVVASFQAKFDQANQAFSDAYDNDDDDDDDAVESTIEGLWDVVADMRDYLDKNS